MIKKVECEPDPKRAILGFRDTGYSLNTAVADIIDNSINARANNVWIILDKRPDNQLYARIIDDGYGMDRDGLFYAMKYGSPEQALKNSLGRFGLGLKTASTSICKRLTLITRKSKTSNTYQACWDLDLVSDEGKWYLQIGDAEGEYLDEFNKYVTNSGTMVCWDAIDRLGTRQDLDSKGIGRQVLGSHIRSLRSHLSLVYHRYMESGVFTVFLNGEKIEPWNPFLPAETTEHHVGRDFSVQLPGSKTKYPVTLNAYIIPNKHEYSTEEARRQARLSSRAQGFYVYRENRVIIYGDWLGIYAQEPHLSLLRVELSFPRELDEIFKLDIKKSTLALDINPALRQFIEKQIDPARRAADKRYRQGKRKDGDKKTSAHDRSQKLLNEKYYDTTENVTATQISENQVKITNVNGTTIVTMPTIKTTNFKDLVEIVDSLDEGLFWEPALINNRLGVRINKSHVYYERVYVPNLTTDTVTVCGIDSVLWALAKCEHEVMSDDVRKKLTDLRYNISRTLRELASELPEPPDTED